MPQSRGLERESVNNDSVHHRAVDVSRVMVSVRSQSGLRCELPSRPKPLRDRRHSDVALNAGDELGSCFHCKFIGTIEPVPIN